MQVQPYLYFDGHCEEAIGFYKKALGGEIVSIMRYKDSPEPPPPGMVPDNWGDKIMHCSLDIAGSTIMAADGPQAGKSGHAGYSLSINLEDEARAEKLFRALGEGGQVHMPLAKTFFAKRFGMLTDRFGVGWMVHVA